MTLNRLARAAFAGGLVLSLSACGGGLASGDSGLFGGRSRPAAMPTDGQDAMRAAGERQAAARDADLEAARRERNLGAGSGSSLWDLFGNNDDPNTTVKVNKYIWNAALDVLNFLPIQSVDPFTGVIVTGYGTPPGGGRSYRATVYVQDPALDARSLKVALQTSGGGAVSAETARAIEDAILTRARQLRIRDSKL